MVEHELRNSASIVSTDCNYNVNMEEAKLYEQIHISNDSVSPKIFDA